jgi:hypothetical protein
MKKKFKPFNYKLLCKSVLKLKRKEKKNNIASRKAVNKYVRLKHMRIKLHSLLSTARRLYYSKHLFVCYYMVKLFRGTTSYSINQGLVQKKLGFQNLRNFFSKMDINIFLLARKDMNYLRAYKKINKRLNSLFYGGYTFLVYVEDIKIKLNSEADIIKILNPFINYYKLFISKEGMGFLMTKAVSFAKIYPLLIKFANGYYTMDIAKDYIHFFFRLLPKNIYQYYDFENIIKEEKMIKILENNMKLNVSTNIYELVAKIYVMSLIPLLLSQQINKMKFFIYKLYTDKNEKRKKII